MVPVALLIAVPSRSHSRVYEVAPVHVPLEQVSVDPMLAVPVIAAGGVVSAYDGSAFAIDSGRILACGATLQPAMIEGLASCRPLAGASYGAPELDSP